MVRASAPVLRLLPPSHLRTTHGMRVSTSFFLRLCCDLASHRKQERQHLSLGFSGRGVGGGRQVTLFVLFDLSPSSPPLFRDRNPPCVLPGSGGPASWLGAKSDY